MSAAAGVDNNQELRAAWGFSTYFYAVEKDGDLYRYTRTGGPWAAKITTCSDLYDMDIERMWGDGTGNVYLAGKNKGPNPDEGTVFLYDQNTNSCSIAYSTTTTDKFNGVAGDGSIVFAAGKAGTIVDNATGSWVESTAGTQEIKDVWVSSSKTAYYAAKGGFVTVCNQTVTLLDHFSITIYTCMTK